MGRAVGAEGWGVGAAVGCVGDGEGGEVGVGVGGADGWGKLVPERKKATVAASTSRNAQSLPAEPMPSPANPSLLNTPPSPAAMLAPRVTRPPSHWLCCPDPEPEPEPELKPAPSPEPKPEPEPEPRPSLLLDTNVSSSPTAITAASPTTTPASTGPRSRIQALSPGGWAGTGERVIMLLSAAVSTRVAAAVG